VRRPGPGRAGPGGRAGSGLGFLLLLALDVIVQRALVQRRHVYDDPGPVRGVVADGHPFADRQGELDLGYPVRVAKLLSSPDLGEAPRFRTARLRLVQVGQFLAELHRLAVFESHGEAHLRHPAVGGGGLAVFHHALEGFPVADELFPLGLGHRPGRTRVTAAGR
jgi:hypothetical protein